MVSRECLEQELDKGDQIHVMTSDSTIHRGYFAGVDTTDSVYALGFSEAKVGRSPKYTVLAFSDIESLARSRRLPAWPFAVGFFGPIAFVLLLAAAWN